MMHHGKTLKDVRRQLAKAKLADAVAVQMSYRQWWNPLRWYRSFQFIYKNRRRQRSLKFLSDRSMGFVWRSSIPKKKQRAAGMLPKLT